MQRFLQIFRHIRKRDRMKRVFGYLLLIPMLAGCNMETFTIQRDLNNRIGTIDIHRCLCTPSVYRFLIATPDNKDTIRYNPINLTDDYKDDNYKIVFSADLLSDSSIVYANTPTDGVTEDFKVRNIRLTAIRKCSDLTLNDTIPLTFGRTYRNYEQNFTLRLDSVTEESRCPYNVECIWAGNAKVKLNFTLNNKPTIFTLNTSGGFVRDIIISGYKIQLIELKPYPVYPDPILQKDYIACIKITR